MMPFGEDGMWNLSMTTLKKWTERECPLNGCSGDVHICTSWIRFGESCTELVGACWPISSFLKRHIRNLDGALCRRTPNFRLTGRAIRRQDRRPPCAHVRFIVYLPPRCSGNELACECRTSLFHLHTATNAHAFSNPIDFAM